MLYVLADRKRLSTSTDIPVFMGDLNKWWCIHSASHQLGDIHILLPSSTLPRIPESSDPESSLCLVKAIIAAAADSILQRVRTFGARDSVVY